MHSCECREQRLGVGLGCHYHDGLHPCDWSMFGKRSDCVMVSTERSKQQSAAASQCQRTPSQGSKPSSTGAIPFNQSRIERQSRIHSSKKILPFGEPITNARASFPCPVLESSATVRKTPAVGGSQTPPIYANRERPNPTRKCNISISALCRHDSLVSGSCISLILSSHLSAESFLINAIVEKVFFHRFFRVS